MAGIHELDFDVFANAVEVAVVPRLEGKVAVSPPPFLGALIIATGGMGADLLRRAEVDVNVAPVGLPARLAGGIMLVGVCDAPVVLLAELVVGRIGIGIAAQPELLNKSVALFVVAQVYEGFALFVGNDVGDVLLSQVL